jgi:hypothetical protein
VRPLNRCFPAHCQDHYPPRRRPEVGSAMRAAFESALRRRVDDYPSGKIVLPTCRRADVAEVKKILCALDLARRAGGRR